MRLSLVILIPLLAASAAMSADAAERSFVVGNFSEIVLSSSADVEVRTGVAPSAVAVGEQADLDRLDIRVEGGRLLIGSKADKQGWSLHKGVVVRVGARSLEGAIVSGSGDMSIDRVKGDFSGRVSGSGGMSLPAVDAGKLTLALSGSGDMRAAGRCATGTLSLSGSGDIDAAGLACRVLTASISGSGDINARATETAALRVAGSGDIELTGGARCTSSITGSGTTRCS